MTLVSIGSLLRRPGIGSLQGFTGQTTNGSSLTAAGHYEAFIFSAPQDMTISHVGVWGGGSVNAGVVDVRIETVAATGFPSGTLWATNTNGSISQTGNTWSLVALTASATVTKGQMVCLKIAYTSGTIAMIGKFNQPSMAGALPYQVTNTATPTKAINDGWRAAIGNSSTTFYNIPGLLPVTSFTTDTMNNATAGTARGLRFQVPFECRAVGLSMWLTTTLGDFTYGLYSDAGTELSSSATAYDGDMGANLNGGHVDLFFDNTVTLSANTWYRLILTPTSATNVSMCYVTLPSAAYMTGMPGGANQHRTTFTTAGGWVDTGTATTPLIDVLIDQVNDSGGAGGSVTGVIGS